MWFPVVVNHVHIGIKPAAQTDSEFVVGIDDHRKRCADHTLAV